MKYPPFDDYYFEVICEQLNFKQGEVLQMNNKSVSVFVLTDKAVYKPSDTVQFQVIVLNESFRPLDEKKVEIYITDDAQNRVKQFEDIIFTKGVYQAKYTLSDAPILGNWHIVVLVDNRMEEKPFKVSEYTLPTFEVLLYGDPPHTHFDKKIITAIVEVKYSFGKMAIGNANVMAEVGGKNVTQSIQVNGKQKIEFHMEKDLNIKNRSQDLTVKLFARFVEKLTVKDQNATATVQVHTLPFKILLKKQAKKFKPGLPFTVEAILQYYDNNEFVTDSKNSVEFTVGFRNKKIRHNNGTTGGDYVHAVHHQTIQNGISKLEIEIPESVNRLNVTAKYLQSEISEFDIRRAPSQEDHFITITSKTKM